MIEKYVPKKAYAEQWDIKGLSEAAKENLAMDIPFDEWAEEEDIADEEMLDRLKKSTDDAFVQLSTGIDANAIQNVEKQILLQVIDKNWREHLQQLDALKGVIGLRGYGQRDPLNEYKSESFTLFDTLLTGLRQDVTKTMTRLLINEQMRRQQEGAPQGQQQAAPQQRPAAPTRAPMDAVSSGAPAATPASGRFAPLAPLDPELTKNISRNSPCPCGSGKKYQHCHGRSR